MATFHEVGNRSFEGYALTGLGDALAELGDLDRAATAYRQAVALRRELGQHALEMESQVGLAQVELAQGNLGQAQSHVTAILKHLDAGGSLESPARVHLICYQPGSMG